jgi:plastocyanin
VVLQPHEIKDLVLVPLKEGSYDLTCADHDWEGMVGRIIVK